MNTVIKTQNLTMKFGNNFAVNDVSLEIQRGEIFGFLGPNGSGKTTTIRAMTGRITPTSGVVQTLGLSLPQQRDQLYPRIGVVTDKQSFYERLSARDNLSMFARLHGVPNRRIDELLERFGLIEYSKKAVKGFSLGMRQKLLLARAFLGKPDLLFLDEPTRGLDPSSARILRTMIREENKRGCTIFLTTHYMDEADQLCDRVGLIAHGKLEALDTPAQLKESLSKPEIHLTCKGEVNRPIEHMVFNMNDPQEMNQLSEILKSREVINLQRHQPTLEEVFLEMTGANLTGEQI